MQLDIFSLYLIISRSRENGYQDGRVVLNLDTLLGSATSEPMAKFQIDRTTLNLRHIWQYVTYFRIGN